MFSVTVDYVRNQAQHFNRKAEVAADERDITDHIVIITGSNHGIGWQTALELAKRGARVIMACRDLTKAEAAKTLILEEVPQGKLEIFKLDLSDSKSVRAFSDAIHKKFSHIDMLINNAGIYKFDGKVVLTTDGFEQHIGVNHLNPFLLTLLLLDLLKKAKQRSRIVNLASLIHQLHALDPCNLNLDGVTPSRFTLYSNSKMANILFTQELARRLGTDSNIDVYALCPGMVNPERPEDRGFLMKLWTTFAYYSIGIMDLEDGALCTLHCALSKSLEGESGKMYRFLDVWNVKTDDTQAAELWTKSEELVGLNFQKP